eukprot:gb/GEZN01014974.1/.p1 GENE.gb/GEZN01014974.1/~~gb/GEZN01014974.1/.p1  ORF type:complete len:168 (-),score=23.13 gb/GEZN01014974.1/:418-849(-)
MFGWMMALGLEIDGSSLSYTTFSVKQGPPELTAPSHWTVDGLLNFKAGLECEDGIMGVMEGIIHSASLLATEESGGSLVFSFGGDKLLVDAQNTGVADPYAVVRPVVGGMGKFIGARGWLASTRLSSGDYVHEFRLNQASAAM